MSFGELTFGNLTFGKLTFDELSFGEMTFSELEFDETPGNRLDAMFSALIAFELIRHGFHPHSPS